ncbi:DM DNA-binding domain-containing protein [Strongyloides ratti]|uniref:DM DNA-binding domain-containing protein n=1 Tax=Strongyloides ratti TaxID=34506 RepID=A0A090L334_STRRB|nr:DM DNA-binding domain-containing protein [Strongyloides ratti]CEF61894.1 DM DNA-binding domain-containing protein [Strongyloides ratti]
MPKEQYMCQLCANHGIFNQPKKGHKQKCSFRNCLCNSCGLNTKRRALDQIERKLRVKESLSPPILEKQTPIMPITIPYIKNQFKKSSDVTTNAISNTSQSNFVSLQSTNTPSMINLPVSLPPTIPIFSQVTMKSNLSLSKQQLDEKKNDNQNNNLIKSNQQLCILTKKNGIEKIDKGKRSIFHSVEMLAKEET